MSHSAQVDIVLFVGGRAFPMAALGPDFLRLRTAVELPAGPAEIALTIDGQCQRWPVKLPHGAGSAGRKVALISDS